MKRSRTAIIIAAVALLPLVALSCGSGEKKEQAESKSAADSSSDKTIDYIKEDVSFGLYFDKDGTQRTITLKDGEDTFDAYVILKVPEYMEITGVEWRLVLPEGLEVVNDKPNEKRIMSMGTMHSGISEGLRPCVNGPAVILHTLTLKASGALENAVLSIMPSLSNKYLGVTECKEGYPMVVAASYKAVVNPAEE